MRSFLNYMGGKSRLAKRVAPRLPACRCYCEVFGGAAWVLFAREPAAVEVLNDVNGRLVNLYRVVRDRPGALTEALVYLPRAREIYYELLYAPAPADAVLAAAAYYYLVKNAFSGRVGFGFSAGKRYAGRYSMVNDFQIWAGRLNKVTLENLPYEKCIARYDGGETAFYLDPPYMGKEDYYGGLFAPSDHARLRDILRGVKARWLVSYNDCREARALYRGFNVRGVRTQYSAAKVRAGARRSGGRAELLIANY